MNSKRSMGLHCIIVITFLSYGAAMELRRGCQRDSECGSNSFCNGGICDRCIPCQTLFNRMPPEDGICARTEDDCGVCLDGFQSKDLTDQRRSFKCFRKVLDGDVEASNFYSLTNILVVTISSLTLIVAIIAIIIYLVKSRKLKNGSVEDRNGNRKMEAVDDLPPPYNTPDAFVTDVEESRQNFIVGRSDEVQLNQATPIYRYYNGIRDEIREDDDTLSIDNPIPHDNAPVHLDGPLTDGSTETIPSSWEPTWADHMDESGGRLGLFQTQSMNDLTEISPLHHGEYRNRHIYLSEFRENLVINAEDQDHSSEPVNSIEPVQSRNGTCEDCEPEPPFSFPLLDREDDSTVENEPRLLTRSILATDGINQGSQDSGFYGFGSSRRRPASNDYEFGLSFFIKRSRQDHS